jgi:hypothetical protein
VEALRRSERALTAAEILKAIPPPSRLGRDILEKLLCEDPNVIPWPPRSAKARPRYWTRRPEDAIASRVGELLAHESLTIGDLQKKAGRDLAGFSPEAKRRLIEAQVEALVAASRVFLHPPPGRTPPRYGAQPARASVYVAKLRKELDALTGKLAAAGITRAQILDALAEETPAPLAAPPSLGDRIVDHLKAKPGGIGVVQLREELGLRADGKAEFDAAVLALYRERRVHLDTHDWPLGLSDSDREELVSDGAGNYFVVISLRDVDAESIP